MAKRRRIKQKTPVERQGSFFDLGLLTSRLSLPEPGTLVTSETTLTTYTMGHPIAEGAFGIVFECVDEWNNQLVAKIPKPENIPPEAHHEKVIGELNALVHVRHPNIIHVHDAFALRGTYYIVTERCDQTLSDLLDLKNFSPRTWFMPVARCLLQAAHFVHVQGMAHCDIHLGNVFVRVVPDEVAPSSYSAATFKLGDFGLARTFGSLSAEGTFLNHIRPPEAIDEKEFGPVDHRVDIFQLGLILLQVAHGRKVQFDQAQILSGLPRQLAEQTSLPWGAALARMLRRHARDRTPTALQAWKDLQSPANLSGRDA